MLDEGTKLPRPYPVPYCENPDCLAPLDRDAFALRDTERGVAVVFCDACASSAVRFHPDRFKPDAR